jgi:hypothetical protein
MRVIKPLLQQDRDPRVGYNIDDHHDHNRQHREPRIRVRFHSIAREPIVLPSADRSQRKHITSRGEDQANQHSTPSTGPLEHQREDSADEREERRDDSGELGRGREERRDRQAPRCQCESEKDVQGQYQECRGAAEDTIVPDKGNNYPCGKVR